MAFQKSGKGDIRYIADKIEDLKDLPKSDMGSTCFVIENHSNYMINSLGEWISLEDEAGKEEEEKESINLEEILKDYVLKSDVELEKLKAQKYEVTGLPEGSFVDFREKEIRIMCPEDAEWKQQNVGPTGNANMYYMAFKAYAPEGAVSFKEGDRGTIVDEMFTFDHDFAGTDKYGRNYSICWLALAKYDTTTGVWTYFGKTSTTEKYIGWNYVVEWYDANKKLIGADSIRINLSNKNCYLSPFPYYGAK